MGHPDEDSPVFVTSNFHLTVKRVKEALEGEDCYLLVAPTRGINVWCASTGGDMNTQSIIRVVKTSKISEKVEHRKLILPQFSAPGIDREYLKQKTGWNAVFGPAYAKDIPTFLKNNFNKTKDQCKAKFPLQFRLEMLLSMNFLIWVLIGIITLLINSSWFLKASTFFWLSGFILYAGFPFIPTRSGWLKGVFVSLIEMIAIVLFSSLVMGYSWWAYWNWMIVVFVINMWLGFDLRGIVAGYSSEAEQLLDKLGFKSFGGYFSTENKEFGIINLDKDKCIDCETCLNVCPKGVYGQEVNQDEVFLQHPESCFECNACIRQCPVNALSFKTSV